MTHGSTLPVNFVAYLCSFTELCEKQKHSLHRCSSDPHSENEHDKFAEMASSECTGKQKFTLPIPIGSNAGHLRHHTAKRPEKGCGRCN